MNKSPAVFLIMILFISGCTTAPPSQDRMNFVMDPWVKNSAKNLIALAGEPDEITSDGNNGEILIYNRYVDLGEGSGQILNENAGFVSYTNANLRKAYARKMFYVDPKGIIYDWKAEAIEK